jgi:hypothetical protein
MLHSSQVPIMMNVDTGKISPQFHIIFNNKFETVVSMYSEDSLGDLWKAIFHLDCECYEDVDYNKIVMQSYLLSPHFLNQKIITMRLLPLHVGWLQPTLLILFQRKLQ